MESITQKMVNRILTWVIYIYHGVLRKDIDFGIRILSIEDTLDYMLIPGHSIVRFGDGEFMLMHDSSIFGYQDFDKKLGATLKMIALDVNNPNLMICMPEPMCGVSQYVLQSRKYWTNQLIKHFEMYQTSVVKGTTYGNSFVSRPYMIYRDKSHCKAFFEKLKTLFWKRRILVVEGKFSRLGVGNNLFDEAKSIKRIICPNRNAYQKYEAIKEATMSSLFDVDLVLVSIGPAGKLLVKELADQCIWAIDIGHIDPEYEWFLQNAKTKIKLKNKHTADQSDEGISDCSDSSYSKSIIHIVDG